MENAPTRLRGKTSWLITKISAHAHRTLAETLAPVGGHGFEFALLAALEEFGPASQVTLGRRCGIDRSNIHAIVAHLVTAGYATRGTDPADTRRNLITITPDGRRRLTELDRLVDEVQAGLTAALDDAERDQLVMLLTRVLDSQRPDRDEPSRR
jgi:DNA-binding MarR family transcriptional regulator